MSRSSLWLVVLLTLPLRAHAGEPKAKADAKPLLETWQAAYFEGLKVGHMHNLVRQLGTGDSARISTTRSMELMIKRYGSVVPITIEQTCEETSAGKVLSLSTSQQIGKSPKMTSFGQVDGENLLLKTPGSDVAQKVPFDTKSMGLYAQDVIFRHKKVKPGDKLTIVSYEVMLAGTITLRAVVKDKEKVDQLVAKKGADGKVVITRAPATLLRIDTTPDPIKIGGNEVRMPMKSAWLDSTLMPVREQFEMPGLGLVTFYTTTKEAALKEGVAPDRLPDFGLNINIPVKQTIDDPYQTTEAVYRVTMKEKLSKVFTEDDRQKIQNVTDKSLELIVKAQTEPGTEASATPPGKEYLESNVFLDWDDARIKALATEATKKTDDPWKKALLLERWVYDNMKSSNAVGFPSASQIARDLEGDCRQHALLFVAMCRAVGIPSRTAIGLVYVREPGRSPFFGFHMWGEVWVKGKWVALDSRLGQGKVGATHLTMDRHHWSKTATLAPLLSISQTLGKLQIEVVKAR
jgi:hypothetical protein